MQLSEPEASAERPPQPTGEQRWYVGTLSYTKRQLIIVFSWLLWGDFAWSMKDRAIGPVATIIIKKFHASDVLMSLFLVAVPAAIGIILGPIISFKSDRTRGKWGRRIPYLAMTTPFAALAVVGLGFSAAMGGALHRLPIFHGNDPNHLVLMCFGACWILFEVATVAANAVFGALVNDVVPRELLGRFYGLFRAFSLIAGMVFNFKLIGYADNHYSILFLAVGLLYGIGFLLMCVKVKEGQYPPVDDVPADGHMTGIFAAQLYLKECFSNLYYRWLIATLVICGLVFLPFNLYSLPFAKALDISTKQYGNYLGLTYLISLCLSFPLGMVADRFHPLRAGIVCMSLYAAVTLWGSIYATHPVSFGIALVAHGVISGCFFTTTASLGQRLFPKLRYAQFASAAGLIASISNMVAAPVMGSYLDFCGHIYRYTLDVGFILSLFSVFLLIVTHSRFVKLGGHTSYVAPE